MYTLLNTITIRKMVFEQAPALALSLVIAELFFKFHSFTLETMAFLITWFAADGVITFFKRVLSKPGATD